MKNVLCGADPLAAQHHESPSLAAIRNAEEARLGRELTKAEERALRAGNTAIELPNSIHAQQLTTGGRNTAEQIARDAQNLSGAARRDVRQVIDTLETAGYDREAIARAARQVREMNWNRGF